MRVAIVHYHVHPGGVTRVIEHTVEVLRRQGARTLVLCGEAPDSGAGQAGPDLGPMRVVPRLGYAGSGSTPAPTQAPTSRELEQRLREAAAEGLGGMPDIWHLHNHGLGKNPALPRVVRQLAEAGQRLLLQIHDFAEDGRPANYRGLLADPGGGDPGRLAGYLYPLAGQVHYAVLNGRDQAFLAAAGIPQGNLHLLPNAVWLPAAPGGGSDRSSGKGAEPAVAADRRLWLYPTRAIRRKNLGELLLWAALAGPDDQFAATQGPRNPLERPYYESWCALAAELQLPVEFEAGARPGTDFAALLGSAHALMTTSVAEGFGLAFLEPWLVRRPLAGRDLPEITTDFAAVGLDLSGLYARLEVPLAWLGREQVEAKVAEGLARVWRAYGRTPTRDDTERAMAAWVRDGWVDFGRLDEAMQATVIRRVAGSAEARLQLRPGHLPDLTAVEQRVAANQRLVRDRFGLDPYGTRLTAIYQQLLEAPREVPGAAAGEALLDRFLAPERLYLLRS